MQRLICIIILLCSIGFSQLGLTGGITYSKLITDEEIPSGYNIVMSPGFKIGLEMPSSKLITGIAYTQRGSALEAEFFGIDMKTKYTYNYLTAYTLMPLFPSSPKFNIYFGGEVGTFLGGQMTADMPMEYMGEEIEETIDSTMDREEWEDNGNSLFDYGFLLGARYQLSPKMSLNANYYLGLNNLSSSESATNKTFNHSLQFTLSFGGGTSSAKRSGSSSSPSPSVDGVDSRPEDCGSAEIDNFKNAAFDLNDKIVELKDKLKGVSDGLAESNDILAAIAAHSEGPLGWSRQQIVNAILKATQGPTFNVETNPAVEKVLNAFKEAEGNLQEKIVIAIKKASEASDALVAIDMDMLITLKIDYDPTKMIREKLGTLKTGVVDGAKVLKSVPDDLKAIGEQAKSLLSSAGALPKAAKSLGFSKAPAALKSIKATTGVLKNIPNEVTAIGDESKKVMEEIDKVLKNIQSILSN